ncbi:MAG: hypothetical protein WBQ14_00720 [Gaiellaceae bacterium]
MLVGVVTGATTGVAMGAVAGGVVVVVVSVVAGGVAVGVVLAGGVSEPPLETCRGRFGSLAAFASSSDVAALSLAAWPITLVSTAASPDEYEPEACFDELD